MSGSWILSASVNFFRSMPRYTLTMFPMFILFALLGRNRFWAGALTVWSLFLSRCLPCYLPMVNGHSEILNETSRCEIEAGRNRLLVS